MECDWALESSQGKLQLWLRPHSNRRLELGVMSVQSPRSPTRDSFGTHSYDILGARMLWKPKEAIILKNFIDQPV